MTTIHVVTYNIGNRGPDSIAGAFSDPEVARKVRMAVGFSAVSTPIELDHIHPGYLQNAAQLGIDLKEILK